MINISGGSFQYFGGGPVALGVLELRLSFDCIQEVVPGTVVAGVPITINLDTSGNAPKTTIWSNSELEPDGSYYTVKLYDSNGVPVFKTPLTWIFTQATGSDVNLSSMNSSVGLQA